MYGDEEGIPRKNVRRGDNKSSLAALSESTSLITSSGSSGCD